MRDLDFWLSAQAQVVGAALLDSNVIPMIAAELRPEDFCGTPRKVWEVMLAIFRESRNVNDVDPVSVVQRLGETEYNIQALSQLMTNAALPENIARYIDSIKTAAKLDRLRELGKDLTIADDAAEAMEIAGRIGEQMIDRPGMKFFSPADLEERFQQRHRENVNWLTWPLRELTENVPTRRGMFGVIGAEPSGGKTAFALSCMLAFAKVARVLFISLETDEDQLYDCLKARQAKIAMNSLMHGKLSAEEFRQSRDSWSAMQSLDYQIIAPPEIDVNGIKAAALNCGADIVIIDYIGLISPTDSRLPRHEQVAKISRDLHRMAKATGMLVLALAQVVTKETGFRDRPLDRHSIKESSQIEADADFMVMVDMFIDKFLKEQGCKCNRVLRVVKNKHGQCFAMPMLFYGKYQTFERAYLPNPEMEKIRNTRPKAAPASAGMEQLGMDYAVPFEE